jgi:hypothetical protein
LAIKRTSSNSLVNAPKMSTGFSSAAIPNAPTIGVATTVNDSSATVAYTAAILGATASSFTATSTPGSLTGTGSSPITVSGLTASTSYTFTVRATNSNGSSSESSASNSITTDSIPSFYESISTVLVGSGGQSTIEFTSIPSTYTHLQVRFITSNTSDNYYIQMQFNSSTNDYHWHRFDGDGTNVTVTNNTSPSACVVGVNSVTANTNVMSSGVVDILDYANTNKYKVSRSLHGFNANSTDAGQQKIGLYGSLWKNTNAITSIKFLSAAGNFAQNSSFALYGIKGA